MTISEKILKFLESEGIDPPVFYSKVGMSRQLWSQTSKGKSNFTTDVIKKIKSFYPNLDLNKLLDDNQEEYLLVAEERAQYGKDDFTDQLSSDLKKVIKQLEKYTK